MSLLTIIHHLLSINHPLPSIINILMCKGDIVYNDSNILELANLKSCLPSSYTIASLEIGLYDIARVPMNLYPSIPLLKFQFGPTAKPPFIKLSDYGILGLNSDIFYLCDKA